MGPAPLQQETGRCCTCLSESFFNTLFVRGSDLMWKPWQGAEDPRPKHVPPPQTMEECTPSCAPEPSPSAVKTPPPKTQAPELGSATKTAKDQPALCPAADDISSEKAHILQLLKKEQKRLEQLLLQKIKMATHKPGVCTLFALHVYHG